ncbi:MAG: DUF2062 domain-containing protein [Hydrogenophaga sp.]|jgi:uncharacterized protein (DUF2062 family)|nr:DUF2062 domain-containing protein [Hydrogenophaga sp.]
MKAKLKQLLPSRESLHNNRWLKWMGPVLHHPRLWHFSRKGIALGMALGIFFGLLIPVAQIPFSASVAVLLRANLPMAVASTLVTNPVTFGPVYYGAYRLGEFVLGKRAVSDRQAVIILEKVEPATDVSRDWRQRMLVWFDYLRTVGKPLALGLAIVATLSGIAVYFLINALWVLKTRWSRRRRLRARADRADAET